MTTPTVGPCSPKDEPPDGFIPGYLLMVVGFSSAEGHARLVAPIREALPLFELVTPIPYAALQRTLDESAPWGLLGYQEVIYLDEHTDDVIATIVERMPQPVSGTALHRVDMRCSPIISLRLRRSPLIAVRLLAVPCFLVCALVVGYSLCLIIAE